MDANELLKKLLKDQEVNDLEFQGQLQDAQNRRDERVAQSKMLEAGNALARAFTQTQADPNLLKDSIQRADQPLQDVLLSKKLQDEKKKQLMDQIRFDVENKKALQDIEYNEKAKPIQLQTLEEDLNQKKTINPLTAQSMEQQIQQSGERFGMDKDRFKREQELYPLEKQAKQLGLKKTEMDISQDVEANNPESDISKASIEIINEAMKDAGMKGVIAPGSMSYATISKIYPNIAYMIGNKFRSQERAEDREAKLEEKRAEKAKLSDKQISDLTNIDNTLDAISNIESIKPSMDTGIVSNLQNTAAQKLGVDDPKKSAFKALVQDQLAQYIKNISGAAVSDQERAFLLQNLPNTSDNDATFNAKLDAVKTRIAKNRERMLSNLKIQGKKTEEFVRNSQKNEPVSDPRIDSFMKKNNITDRNEAIKILKEKGYIK